MRGKKLKNYSLLLLLLAYTLFYRFYLLKHALQYSESITAAFIILMATLGVILLGFQKNKQTRIKKYVTNVTVTIIILFFVISYGIGLVVGFLKNAYSLTFPAIIDNTFAPIVIIICTEILRYVIISSNKNNKPVMVLATILITIFELNISIRTININDLASTFKITTATILPIISKNIVLSYLACKVGFIPGLVYRLVMDIYVYVMPIVPDLGDYLNSMIGIGLPFLIYLYSSRTLDEYYNGVEREFSKDTFKISDIPVLVFIIVLVCLISGYFPYYIIGVGSESMMPKINKGDAVLVHKIKDPDELKVGDIIVFKSDNKNYIHRLVKIENIDGKTYYRTKGDANNTNDDIDLTMKNIKGKVNIKVKYIAYPSIYLSEFLNKEKKG